MQPHEPGELAQRLGMVLDPQRDHGVPRLTDGGNDQDRRRLAATQVTARILGGVQRGQQSRGQGTPWSVKASSMAGHTRGLAMMLAWQETPAPWQSPASGMQASTGVGAHTSGAVDECDLSRRR